NPANDSFYGDREVAVAGGAQLVDNDAEGSKYLRLWYGQGDMCENGLRRVAEVQFSCCENDHIVSVQETTLCQYIIHIHTKRACHKVFQASPVKKPATQITCIPIDKESDFGSSESSRASDKDQRPLSLRDLLTTPVDVAAPTTVPGDSDSETDVKDGSPASSTATESRPIHHTESRADLLKGAASAGIHPSQSNIAQEAFDTLWLDIYDPILIEGEDMDRVVEAANFILLGGDWKEAGNSEREGASVQGSAGELQLMDAEYIKIDDTETIQKYGDDESDGDLEKVDILRLVKDGLQQSRIELWRKLVEKKKSSMASLLDDDDGTKFEGVDELLTLDLWEAALDGVPEEAVDRLHELGGHPE
ncbi:UNVERIFIED_CONTAM: hypothetical protein HDU68_012213, partial [Siphonaria sp. JEL0065]